ncbi:MAG TPA: glycosyltransferase [Pyrinomonadaceae bacterium]|jgi:glycosyltransferase involved in cell wall biosynthesis
MSASQPLVSIGLPVFNGEKYVGAALEALVTQDYRNIEFVVSDNCSTDRTEEICREYAAADPRVRYSRTAKNEGPAPNFHRVFDLANGKYFMWAAHDDLWERSFVSRCVEKLEQTPEAVLACSYVRIIDEDGQTVSEKKLVGAAHPERAKRVRQLLSCQDFAYPVYGLTRREAMRRVLPLRLAWGNDFILLTKLCLLGSIVVVPEVLFSYRTFRKKTHDSMAVNIGLAPGGTMLARNKDTYLGVLRAIRDADLPGREKKKLSLIAAVTYGRQWPGWIKTSLHAYAYPKYLLPALQNRESGNRGLAAYYALRAMAANPFYLLSRAWVIPLEAAAGPRLAGLVRKLARRSKEGTKK